MASTRVAAAAAIAVLLSACGDGGGPTTVTPALPTLQTTDFYASVRTDVEQFWGSVFRASGETYTPLTVFRGFETSTQSLCGPVLRDALYCPADRGVYYRIAFLDSFFSQVGDVAPAFVVAHEIGHHIGFLRGYLKASQSSLFPSYPHVVLTDTEYELQADCFGGAWAADAAARDLFETEDVANTIATLVALASYQRVAAFSAGFTDGVSACGRDDLLD